MPCRPDRPSVRPPWNNEEILTDPLFRGATWFAGTGSKGHAIDYADKEGCGGMLVAANSMQYGPARVYLAGNLEPWVAGPNPAQLNWDSTAWCGSMTPAQFVSAYDQQVADVLCGCSSGAGGHCENCVAGFRQASRCMGE